MKPVDFCIDINIPNKAAVTERMAYIMGLFGVSLNRLLRHSFQRNFNLRLCGGDICLILGHSGAGKSLILNQIYEQTEASQKIRLTDIPLSADKSLIDSLKGDVFQAVRVLNIVGLSDVFTMLQTPAALSEGQQYRFCLAAALMSKRKYIFADEFGSTLDRVSAVVLAARVRKFAKSQKRVFVLAAANEDIIADLWPNVLVVVRPDGTTRVDYRKD